MTFFFLSFKEFRIVKFLKLDEKKKKINIFQQNGLQTNSSLCCQKQEGEARKQVKLSLCSKPKDFKQIQPKTTSWLCILGKTKQK